MHQQGNIGIPSTSICSINPNNMTTTQRAEAESGWWNGVNIIVRDPEDVLAREFPPTRRSRVLYENEHVLQSHRFAEVGTDALDLIQDVVDRSYRKLLRRLRSIRRKATSPSSFRKGPYRTLNTYSDSLTTGRFNGAVDTNKSGNLE